MGNADNLDDISLRDFLGKLGNLSVGALIAICGLLGSALAAAFWFGSAFTTTDSVSQEPSTSAVLGPIDQFCADLNGVYESPTGSRDGPGFARTVPFCGAAHGALSWISCSDRQVEMYDVSRNYIHRTGNNDSPDLYCGTGEDPRVCFYVAQWKLWGRVSHEDRFDVEGTSVKRLGLDTCAVDDPTLSDRLHEYTRTTLNEAFRSASCTVTKKNNGEPLVIELLCQYPGLPQSATVFRLEKLD